VTENTETMNSIPDVRFLEHHVGGRLQQDVPKNAITLLQLFQKAESSNSLVSHTTARGCWGIF